MSEFALLKQIARQIRYRKVAELVGQTVHIENLDTVGDKVTSIAQHIISEDKILNVESIQPGAFYKYGLLDITVEVSADLLASNYRSRVYLLADMGWLSHADMFSVEERLVALEQLWDDIIADKTCLKLFLKSEKQSTASDSPVDTSGLDEKTRTIIRIMDGKYRLPATFTITDAYLTNARSIGMWRNFYL